MKQFFLIGGVCMLAALPIAANAGPNDPSTAHPFGKPHPEAPANISEFAFAIGEWKCTNSGNGPERADERTLSWRFNYALNGRAIEDYFEDANIRG